MKMYGYITYDKLNMLACHSREQALADLILVITSCISSGSEEEAKRLIDKYYKEIELEYTEVP